MSTESLSMDCIRLGIAGVLILVATWGIPQDSVAQTTVSTPEIQGIETDTDQETTISVRKRSLPRDSSSPSAQPSFQIVSGEADVEGEPGLLDKDARANWKKACEEWKSELKSLNKRNEIVALQCGSTNCGSIRGQSICRSKAAYTIKIRNEN